MLGYLTVFQEVAQFLLGRAESMSVREFVEAVLGRGSEG